MQTIRTFIAVEVSAATRKRAADAIERLRASGAKVSWVKPDNMHLTLKFLGDVPNVQIPEICRAVTQAAAELEPFEMQCHGLGAFPDLRRPRTIWIGVEEGKEGLVQLHAAIDKSLAKLGFAKEGRRFQPHLTIGRVRQGGSAALDLGQLVEQNADFQFAATVVSEALAIASYLDKSGATYEILGRAPLGR
jgi:2'-5' RNA ligase